MRQLRLPVGIEDFAEIRRNEYYYVDKTQLIEQVLDRRNKVTLFTRPRRFGKTLNMSMLRYFFEIGTDVKLFEELFIAQNHELCEKYMGKYPVVSISLKSINADSYSKAKAQLIKLVNREARRVQFLMDSDRLTAVDKALFTALLDREMEEDTLVSSIQELTELLEIHFNQKVIVLIDEYDVPLAKANQNGYYDKMVLLLRNFLENVLKTNESLEFAVLTGCLRIAKESIFTGLNNFKVYSITDADYDEMFGFNDKEVKEMLLTFDQQEKYDEVKEWYDGYRFGNADVYCPWDVVNYCADHLTHPGAVPKNYWLNTSGNEVINRFIDSVDEPQKLAKTELERLVSGNVVRKRIDEAITYKELYSTIDNLWSTLFMTGYLTQRGCEDDGRYRVGFSFGRENMRLPIWSSIPFSVQYNIESVKTILDALKNMVFRGKGVDDMTGPVGTIYVIQEVTRQGGFEVYLEMLALISVNLGVMNLLPIPGLDGSRLLFLLVEAIRRKPVKRELEGAIHLAGFALLMGLMVLLTYKDIIRFFVKG